MEKRQRTFFDLKAALSGSVELACHQTYDRASYTSCGEAASALLCDVPITRQITQLTRQAFEAWKRRRYHAAAAAPTCVSASSRHACRRAGRMFGTSLAGCAPAFGAIRPD